MFSDPTFLSSSRLTTRERDAIRMIEERRARTARISYRLATLVLVAAMSAIAVPQLRLGPWAWHIVGGTALVMTAFGILMVVNGRVSNGLLTLVCAFTILPGWIWIAPHAESVGKDIYQMFRSQWSERVP